MRFLDILCGGMRNIRCTAVCSNASRSQPHELLVELPSENPSHFLFFLWGRAGRAN